ncbi:alpha/beta hydrolase [Paenibacillaceae bacterium WGS1546]|uniref:alpha/beta hydrolase n=1 Tax=Cohnella sp. WGS1546 TaxID=3366810 RepID=UPI00372CF4D3
MTTLTTPVPLADSEKTNVYVGPASGSATTRRLRKGSLRLAAAGICLTGALFVAFHAVVAYFLAYPPVPALASNPQLAKNLAYAEVTFASADGASLVEGWWIPADDSRSTVVLSHGYGTNREEPWVPMYDLAEHLHGLRYNVLMFDYGFASASRAAPATGGRLESRQLLGAIEFARSQGSERLIVWGFSMGAGTALQAALLQPRLVDAMILDSVFLADEHTLYHNVRRYAPLPKTPTVSLLRWFFPLTSGTRLDQIPSAEVQETAFDFPILLIHGTADDKSPVALADNIARSQTNASSGLWLVEDAIHEMTYRTHTEEYVRRTSAFLNEVSGPAPASPPSADVSLASLRP